MNYWVVGASWGGVEHQDQKFVNGGYWMLGWEEKNQPSQYSLAEKMKPGTITETPILEALPNTSPAIAAGTPIACFGLD